MPHFPIDPYAAACLTAQDMISPHPGNPFSGLRGILGSAVRLPAGLTRKAAIRSRLAALLSTTYYEGGSLWQTSQTYRRALVGVLEELCRESLEYEEAMEEMRDAQKSHRLHADHSERTGA
jgi:hypothetical protein